MIDLSPQRYNVARARLWAGHRAKRTHLVGVVIGEQVHVMPSVVVTLLCPMNRESPNGGIPPATHKLA
jgi:hypothetical protein